MNAKKTIFLLISTMFLLVLIPPVLSIGFFEDFQFRKQFNLKVNYTIDETRFTNLTNYTAYLSFDSQTLVGQGKLNADCSNLRITDLNNIELNFEIEELTCNSNFGTPIYIRYDSLKHDTTSENNSIFIYYGSPTAIATSAEFQQNTWDKRYTSIMHMHNTSLKDSVTGILVAPPSPTLALIRSQNSSMPIGNFLDFIAGTDTGIGTNNAFTPPNAENNLTMEVVYFARPSPAPGTSKFHIIGLDEPSTNRAIRIGASYNGQLIVSSVIGTSGTQFVAVGVFGIGSLRHYIGSWFNQDVIGASETSVRAFHNGKSIGGQSLSNMNYGQSRNIRISAGSAYRGFIDEVRISTNFPTHGSKEYAELTGNIFLRNADFWTEEAEETDNPPTISLSISATNIDSGLPIQVSTTCNDDFGLSNIIIENDVTGSFQQVNSGLLSGLQDTFVHDDTSIDGSEITVTYRVTCFDNGVNSITATISYITNTILPLQGVVEIVGVLVLIFLTITFFTQMIKKGK